MASVVVKDGAVGVLADGAEAVAPESGVCGECCGGEPPPLGNACCQDTGNGSNQPGTLCGAEEYTVPGEAPRVRFGLRLSGSVGVDAIIRYERQGFGSPVNATVARVAATRNININADHDAPSQLFKWYNQRSLHLPLVSQIECAPGYEPDATQSPSTTNAIRVGVRARCLPPDVIGETPLVEQSGRRLSAIDSVREWRDLGADLISTGPGMINLVGYLNVCVLEPQLSVSTFSPPPGWPRFFSAGYSMYMAAWQSVKRARDGVGASYRCGSLGTSGIYVLNDVPNPVGAYLRVTAPETAVINGGSACVITTRMMTSVRSRQGERIVDQFDPNVYTHTYSDITTSCDLTATLSLFGCATGREGLGGGERSARELLAAFLGGR